MDLATALAASGQDEAAHAELTRPLGRHPGCVPARELMTRLRPLKPGTHVWRLQNSYASNFLLTKYTKLCDNRRTKFKQYDSIWQGGVDV